MHIIYLPESRRYINLEQVALVVEEGSTISCYSAHSQVRLLTVFGTDAALLRRHLGAEADYHQRMLVDDEDFYAELRSEVRTASVDEPADGTGDPQLPARRG